MNEAARSAFRRAEILDMNAEATGMSPSERARSDFRRGEIVDMNEAAVEEARGRKMATWGLVALFAVIVYDMMFVKTRSK